MGVDVGSCVSVENKVCQGVRESRGITTPPQSYSLAYPIRAVSDDDDEGSHRSRR